MLFNSLPFILGFMPIVLVGFYAIERVRGHEAGLLWLVAASVVFYGWWDWRLVGLLAASVVVNYAVSLGIAARPTRARLIVGIVFNLGLLGWFKYAGFFARSLDAVVGTSFDPGPIVLPLAISFFTFQQIAYLVDVFRGVTREPSLLRYGLFVTFFPQLIAGPIVHHSEMLPQFAKPEATRIDPGNFSLGALIFAAGLLKKVALADTVSPYADDVFSVAGNGGSVSFVTAWTATVAFGLQIYFDFSGYSDMAIGLARMFGIRLPLNFDSPYTAVSITDFWHRWHMTLSRFLRDYLYVPLGGNRRGPFRRYINLMIVMLLGGLWHGANWTFVAWGGLHGFYLVVNHLWRRLRPWPAGATGAPGRAASWLLTFLAVTVAWVFFRAADFGAARTMLEGLSGAGGVVLPESYLLRLGAIGPVLADLGVRFGPGGDVWIYPNLRQLATVGAILAIALLLPNTQQWLQRYAPASDAPRVPAPGWLGALPVPLNGATGAATGFLICVLAALVLARTSNAFVYFQF